MAAAVQLLSCSELELHSLHNRREKGGLSNIHIYIYIYIYICVCVYIYIYIYIYIYTPLSTKTFWYTDDYGLHSACRYNWTFVYRQFMHVGQRQSANTDTRARKRKPKKVSKERRKEGRKERKEGRKGVSKSARVRVCVCAASCSSTCHTGRRCQDLPTIRAE